MLSTIGRAAVRRVVARGPQSTNRALQSTWQLQRIDTLQSADNASSRPRFSFSPQRSYATATKAATKPKANKSTKSTTTKPKAKKATPKKTVKKPVKKKVAVKKVVKKPVKKVLSDRQKAIVIARKNLDEVKALKATALTIPKKGPTTAWMVLNAEYSRANSGTATSNVTAAAAKYKSLNPSELESYNHTAAQNKADYDATYKKWVESHTPDQIRLANNARRALRTIPSRTAGGTWPPIRDSRLPKRATPAIGFFIKDRFASGDFKGIPIKEAGPLLNKEWKSLPASEIQVYVNRFAADRERYIKEYQEAYGRAPDFLKQEANA